MFKKRNAALTLGAVAIVGGTLAATVAPASGYVEVWNGTGQSGKHASLYATTLDYRDWLWSDGSGSPNNKAESYANNTSQKIWFWDAVGAPGSAQGWSNPGGSGNFGPSLANKVSSHRP